MKNPTKEYWFTFEPYIHVSLKKGKALVYNTLDNEYLIVTDKDALSFLSRITKEENFGVIKVLPEDWEKEAINKLITKSRNLFFGDLYDCSLSSRKPIQFYPKLNLQEEVEHIKKLDPNHVGTKMYSYLYQITMELGALKNAELDNFVSVIFKQLVNSHIRRLIIIPSTSEQIEYILAKLKKYEQLKLYVNLFLNPELLSFIPNDSELPIILDLNNTEYTKIENTKISYLIKVQSASELELFSEWIDKNQIENYKIEPIYNGDNLDFFKEHVFINKEDILSKPISMQSIMRNQVLNVNDFGKLHIDAEGNVFSNKLFPSIGNIYTNTLRQLVHKEMIEGKAWLRTRTNVPCSDCVFQWLCPSLGDNEILIGKDNLCSIKDRHD